MASICNNTTSSSTNTQTLGCLDIYDTSCIRYDGGSLVCTNIPTGTFLNDVLCSINNQLCTLTQDSGLVKVDPSDTNPETLIEKIVAGANIVITGVGSGDNRQLRIDAVLGGQIVDELVRVSATDQSSGYLDDKLVVGPCMYIQKVNPGLNEKLQVFIDWQCALNQLSILPGFCTLVTNCIPNAPTVTCPFILLNNPNISGSTITATWLSSGTSYNVYVDGVLASNMPTSSLTYTSGQLINGSHTVEVVALCNSGTPQRDQQTFLINTTCPVPNQLAAVINGGSAGLAWSLDSNSNNQNQSVQYKLNSAANYSTATSVSPVTTSYAINGLTKNSIYNFQIVNNCSAGGPSPSTPVSAIEFTCPNVTLSSTASTVTFSFVGLGGDIDTYVLTLLDSGGTNVIQTKNITQPFSSTITDTFSGLSANTGYQVQVIVKAAQFNKNCAAQTTTTTSIPACPSISNFTATIN